jgi:AAHS family 4-hydroxybenzoate transporter-like MFS transporter
MLNDVGSLVDLICKKIILKIYIDEPTLIPKTGTPSAMSFGRMGALMSSFAGAAMITAGVTSAYLNLLRRSMIIAVISLALISGHIGPKE